MRSDASARVVDCAQLPFSSRKVFGNSTRHHRESRFTIVFDSLIFPSKVDGISADPRYSEYFMSRCTRYLEEMCASSETVRNCYSVLLIEFFLKKITRKKIFETSLEASAKRFQWFWQWLDHFKYNRIRKVFKYRTSKMEIYLKIQLNFWQFGKQVQKRRVFLRK